MTSSASTPPRDVRMGPSDAVIDRKADGTLYVRSPHPLGEYPERTTDALDYWAHHASYRTFLAERESRWSWRNVTYAETQFFSRRIGQALLNRGLSVEKPVVILSGNDIEHALVALGAMYAGIPYAPVAPAYSLVSKDFTHLRHIFGLLTPGLVFVSDGRLFRDAIEAVVPSSTEVLVVRQPFRGATLFRTLVDTPLEQSLQDVNAVVGADTVCRILFSSGSTGMPRPVINTHRMWGSSQEMTRSHFAFLADEPPVFLDWLPWNQEFGANAALGFALYSGGSLYIDRGGPVPGLIEETVKNLRKIAPTMFWNVPEGFTALIPYLRSEPAMARHFFSRLKVLYCVGGPLSRQTWDDLGEISSAACGERVPVLTGFGSAETTSHVLFGVKSANSPELLGLPAPGVEMKMVPAASGKLEARYRGPNVTFGYWRQPGPTRAAFDEEGFFKSGDALRFADASEPLKGFVFDGRLVEDFTLASGVWVSVGPLRARFRSHCAPYVWDLVLAGQNRDYIAALIFPDAEACRGKDTLALFTELLRSYADGSSGGDRIEAAMVVDSLPSLDALEVTGKGSLNTLALLGNLSAYVDKIYAGESGGRDIIRI